MLCVYWLHYYSVRISFDSAEIYYIICHSLELFGVGRGASPVGALPPYLPTLLHTHFIHPAFAFMSQSKGFCLISCLELPNDTWHLVRLNELSNYDILLHCVVAIKLLNIKVQVYVCSQRLQVSCSLTPFV